MEILILFVFLIGLIALTVPHFSKYKCRSKQSEAQFELARIFAAQKLYFAQFGTYVTLQELLDKERIEVHDRYYKYETVGEPSTKFFRIRATGKQNTQVARDVWSIDQEKKLVNESNACIQ